jgi:DNA-binding transcriptional MerR regulator
MNHKDTSLIEETLNIPENKLFFTIKEASKLCGVEPHVLRYWEKEFKENLKPSRREGDRRFYQAHDLVMIKKIKDLLYLQGFTIIGAKQQLKKTRKKEDPIRMIKEQSANIENITEMVAPKSESVSPKKNTLEFDHFLMNLLNELKSLLQQTKTMS